MIPNNFINSHQGFRFVAMGNSRGKKSSGVNEEVLRGILGKIRQLSIQPNLIFFLRDMVAGGSKVLRELQEWKNIISSYYPINLCVPVIGNHEDNETVFSSVFDYLPSGQLQGYQRTVYYFEYFNSLFIVLNSVRRNRKNNYVIGSAQLLWMEDLLQNNTKKHCFVMLHVPPYPTGHHFKRSLDADKDMRDAFWGIIDRYNVTAVFAGHEHNYSRRIIDRSFSTVNYAFRNSIYQIISGGA